MECFIEFSIFYVNPIPSDSPNDKNISNYIGRKQRQRLKVDLENDSLQDVTKKLIEIGALKQKAAQRGLGAEIEVDL